MTPVVNPKTFTITDTTASAESVTSFNIEAGQTSGQYTVKVPVPLANVSGADSHGNYVVTIADLHLQLAPGLWYAAATAVNAAGESASSPEVLMQILPPPSPPSAFSAA